MKITNMLVETYRREGFFRRCIPLCAVLLLLAAPVGAFARESAGQSSGALTEGAYAYGEHLYRVFDEALSWREAKERCEQIGGHLVSITSSGEQAFLESLLPAAQRNACWLGACLEDGAYRWVTGEEMAYMPNEAALYESLYPYLYIDNAKEEGRALGQWGGAYDSESGYVGAGNVGFVCEWDSAAPEETFAYTVLNGTYCVVTGYTGPYADVRIPGELDGYAVLEIDDQAFENHAAITSVEIPEGVEIVRARAFSGCAALNGIALPPSVWRIEAYAFRDCASLSELRYPTGWTSVDGYASPFSGCAALRAVLVPDGATVIPDYAFKGAPIQTVSLPDTLVSIGDYAFCGSALTSVEMPASLTEVGAGAFARCVMLRRAVWPASAARVSECAFRAVPA